MVKEHRQQRYFSHDKNVGSAKQESLKTFDFRIPWDSVTVSLQPAIRHRFEQVQLDTKPQNLHTFPEALLSDEQSQLGILKLFKGAYLRSKIFSLPIYCNSIRFVKRLPDILSMESKLWIHKQHKKRLLDIHIL